MSLAPPPAYVSPKLQARISAQMPPPRAPGAPERPGDQEKKILAQEVEQAIHHLVDTHKQAFGKEATVGQAGGAAGAAAGAPAGAVSQPQQRGAPRYAADGYNDADGVLLARAGADAPAGAAAAAGADPELRGFKVEFTAGPLRFATDLALLFLSCALPIVALSGSHVLTILLVGMMACYIFDYTNQRGLTLAAAWGTVAASWLGLYVSNLHLVWSSPLTVAILLNASLYLLLVGVFATVQFRWFQLQSPELALVGERMLLGLTPLVCIPLLFSTVVSFAGAKLAPFVLAPILGLLHSRFFTLRQSSFKSPLCPEAAAEGYVNGRLEALTSALLCLVLPIEMYFCITHKEHASILHVLNGMALVGIPCMALFRDPEKMLWFMYRDPYKTDGDKGDLWGLSGLKFPMVGGGYLCLLHCFIYRVVMGRYGYLLTGVPPPFNIILICVGCYALSVTLVFAVQLVELEDKRELGWGVALRWMSVLFLSVIGAMALAFVVGMPRFILPFSALSAACLTAYCLDRKNINNYLLFAGCTVLMLMWWMFKSFSFLLVELPILGGTQTISLPQLSVYIIWLYMLECVLFPLAFNQNTGPFYICLVLQAAALAFVEHILYSQPENLYPVTAVAFTTLWGMKMAERLVGNRKLTKGEGAVVAGMYGAKMYLFVVCATSPEPESEFYTRAFRSGELVACYIGMAGMIAAVVQLHLEAREKKRRAHRGAFTMVYCCAAVLVAAFSRQNVVLALLELSTGNSSVQAGRLLGLCIAYAGALQLPLISMLPPSDGRSQRIAAGMLCAGALIALMDPSFETGEDVDELELDVYQAPGWASGLAVVTVFAVAATLLNVVRLPDSTTARMAWWGSISVAAGVAFGEMYLPYASWHSSALLALIFGMLALCVDFCHFSENAQHEDSNTVVGLYTALLLTLLATLLDAQWRFPDGLDEAMRWEAAMQRQMGILSLNAGLNIILAALMKLKLLDNPQFRPRTIAKIDAIRGNMGQGTHFGLLCNICAVQGYVSLLILASNVGGAGPGMSVMLSSLLLLMHDDGWVFDGLSQSDQLSRWAPPLAASLCTLGWQVCVNELPALLNRYPMYFALQLTIFLLAMVLGLVTLRELWVDAHRRRKEGSSDGFVLGTGLVMFLLASTPAVRWTVAVTVLGSAVPLYADSFWARKWSEIL